tara:strand:- start:140644 stop:140769 length:126 start_codon:yes stop_codon:yes gene_type:complete
LEAAEKAGQRQEWDISKMEKKESRSMGAAKKTVTSNEREKP